MSVKELVKNALRGRKVSRPPLIPFIGTYLTKVDGNSLEETMKDPGLLHQALRNTQQLLIFDAVVMPVDPTLEIEAYGIPVRWESGIPKITEHLSLEKAPLFDANTWVTKGRLPVFIEAARRFSQVEGKNFPLFAVLTGPLTIWSMLYNQNPGERSAVKDLPHLDTFVQSTISLCKEYAEAGVDGIIVNEANVALPNELAQTAAGIYKPIFNVINHFNLSGVFLNPQQDHRAPLLHSDVGANAGINLFDKNINSGRSKGSIGIPLNDHFWSDEEEDIHLINRFITDFKGKGVFLTTTVPINQENVDLFDLQEKIEKITADTFWRV